MEKDYRLNHRQRQRDKYKTYGFEKMTELERMEMLLFGVISRKDTKPMAHEYIKKFGSVYGAVTSGEVELLEAGVPEATRIYFQYLKDLFRYFESTEAKRKRYDYESLGNYLFKTLKNKSFETTAILVLDSQNRVVKEEYFNNGALDQLILNSRRMCDLSLQRGAKKVVLAHNHPSGILAFSPEDCVVTDELDRQLNMINIVLMEHFVISSEGYLGYYNDKARLHNKTKKQKTVE